MLLLDGRAPSPSDLDWLLASRALAFGEGVFTSVRVWQQQAIFWPDHQQRLEHGLYLLNTELDADFWQQLSHEVTSLAQQKQEGRAKVMLLAGPGGQGYRRQASGLTWHRFVHLQPLVIQPRAYQGVCAWWQACPGAGPQSESKHLNRLTQVLAAQGCPATYPEALLHDQQGYVKEGIARNLFWYARGQWYTPCLMRGALAGIMRRQLMRYLGHGVSEGQVQLHTLREAEEVFLCNSVQGIWPLLSLHSEQGFLASWPLGQKTQQLMRVFHPQMGLPEV